MSRKLDELIAKAESAEAQIFLLCGDLVVAEPAAKRLGEALAAAFDCGTTVVRHPPGLAQVLGDLQTFSLFEPGKVVVVVESALLADKGAAAALIDDAARQLPFEAGDELTPDERTAASRLLQALRVFGVEITGSAAGHLDQLPDWAFEGAKKPKGRQRKRTKKQVKELREGLVPMLESAVAHNLLGWAEGDLAQLGQLAQSGLPERHALVLVETSVVEDHPVVEQLREKGTFIKLAQVSTDRSGQVTGVASLVRELERETGTKIEDRALDELVKRTLKRTGDRSGSIDSESTARLAAEYRKLATLSGEKTIDRSLVVDTVEDRGDEDVFALLDEIGGGRVSGSLTRLRRLLASAENADAARLQMFSLLADFARQLTAVNGLCALAGQTRTERNYNRFKSQVAPRLQAPLPEGHDNPIGGLHPYRLHRVYLAASRLDRARAARLPWRVLETEARLKGESGDPDVALAELVCEMASVLSDRP